MGDKLYSDTSLPENAQRHSQASLGLFTKRTLGNEEQRPSQGRVVLITFFCKHCFEEDFVVNIVDIYNNCNRCRYSCQTHTAGTGEILRNPAPFRKQYSHWKFFGHFPMISDRFLPEINWTSPEKNPANFRLEYCFHIQLFPMLSCRILQDSDAGIIDSGTS